MCGTAIALGAATLGSSIIGSRSSRSAGNRQADAAILGAEIEAEARREEIDLRREIYDDTTRRFGPWEREGRNAFNAYLSELGIGTGPRGYRGYQASPMAQYLLEEGTSAIEAGAAGAGGLFSGATLEALEANRANTIQFDRNNYMDRLLGVAGIGQASAAQTAAAGDSFAAGAGQAIAGAGAAMGAGHRGAGNAAAMGSLGSAQAWQSGISDMAGIYGYMQNPMMAYSAGTMAPSASNPAFFSGLY